MLYITENEDGSVRNIYESESNNLRDEYSLLLKQKASELQATINPYYHNIMSHKEHHSNLTDKQYKKLVAKWDRVLRENTPDKFLSITAKKKQYGFIR